MFFSLDYCKDRTRSLKITWKLRSLVMPSVKIPRVSLGSQGFVVSQQGLGAMGMSAAYGPPKPEKEMIDLIRYAVESGITFIDTADVYEPYTNEILLGKAIKGIRDEVEVATKFGNSVAGGHLVVRGDPEYVRDSIEGSLKRLDVDYIDLYYQHRIDENVPIEITIGEIKKYVEGGKIKYIGLSEASAADIRRAHAVHPITCIQLEWSLWSRDVEEDVIPTCRELGIGIVPYSPLGHGFFSGVMNTEKMHTNDFRKGFPRFQTENLARNKAFFDRLVAIAAKKNATPGQLALAWVQHQGKDVVPIPGTTKVKNLEENMGAVSLKLTDQEAKEIEDAVPQSEIVGDRYPDMWHTWRHTNSLPLSAWTGVRDSSKDKLHLHGLQRQE